MPSTTIRRNLKDWLDLLALGPRDWLLHLICCSYSSFLWGFEFLSPRYLAWSSRIRARKAFYHAASSVPAYADFLASKRADAAHVPETDKKSYIDAYPIEARCTKGSLGRADTTIDESSGSTGTPYNWARSAQERREFQLFISYFATYCFGREPLVTLNAFSMGAWATGFNMGTALQRNGIVKNTGPDIGKILNTLRFLGPHHRYLILGYPPFVKHLIDVAETENFPFDRYELNALVGGEGMSEGLRDYLLRRLKRVYSGYGATDLEIGIAGETPVSVAIRRLARENDMLRENLFGRDPRLPMLFQFNPLMHHIEVNDKREIVMTITRTSVLSPRIRYNIHDEGGVASFDRMDGQLRSLGYDLCELSAKAGGSRRLRLPFIWIYGRRDSTISIMGANIYPEDLEQCLYAEPELARMAVSFCLSPTEHPGGEVHPCFHFELASDPTEQLKRKFESSMLDRLIALNADFRAAWNEYPEAIRPEIRLYRIGEGPFASDAHRIKQIRLIKQDGSRL